MKNAYAGGGEDWPPFDEVQQDIVDNWDESNYETAELAMPPEDIPKDFIIGIGESIGWWPLFGIVVFGGSIFFKRHIGKFMTNVGRKLGG